jgi:predicted phage terminase large subunit-like protein
MLDFDPRSIDAKLQLIDLERADQEETLYLFYKEAWPYIDPAPWADSWAIEAIAEHLQAVCDGEIRRLLINISPRCSKSNLVSVAFPAWVWAQSNIGPISGPGVPFLHASYANQLSLRDSVKCRRLIESPWYQARWGNRFQLTSDQNTKSRFANNKGGERLITSVDGTNTGEGGMCFAAGTLVSTPNGYRKIEELASGDPVYSFDIIREKVVKSHVVATLRRKANDLCTVYEVSGRRFLCTKNHPVFSPGRGFVRAGEMGSGDRLLVSREIAQTNQNNSSIDLRQLRKENTKTTLRATQGVEDWQSRRLLLQKMLFGAPRGEKRQAMRSLWNSAIKQAYKILLDRLQRFRERATHNKETASETRENMRQMPEKIFRQCASLLFCEMLQCSPFSSDDRGREFQISRKYPVFDFVYRNEVDSQGSGQGSLRGMRRAGNHIFETQEEKLPGGPSHRREQGKRYTGEFDNTLHSVSSESPLWNFGEVSKVEFHSEEAIEVYDIQVEGQNNFFAENILVHNCIIIDDGNAAGDMASEATIQTTLDWWTQTMPTRLNNQETGAYINIQQRLAENDLTGHILETEADDWVHLMIPMRYEPERSYFTKIGWKDPRTEAGELMWPERFSEDAVKRLERRLGPWQAAGQLQQRPEPKGGGIIRRDWWQLWDKDTFPIMDFVLATLDTAYTTKQQNDPSAMIVWGIFSGDTKAQANRMIDSEGRPIYMDRTYSDGPPRVMMMYSWTARLELHELVEKVAKTATQMKVDTLLIEGKASGLSVAQEIRRLYANEKFGVQLFDPKSQDKMARLYSVQHLFAEGLIYSPDRKWAEEVMKQCGQFPAGTHDDLVDCCSMGLRTLRDMGLLTRGPERIAEIEESKRFLGNQTQALYPA